MAPNESTPRRIHIVGGPGSGKTTLAVRLGQVLAVPVHDLDTIAYEGGAGRKRDFPVRQFDAERIAAAPAWVTEGIYLWWCNSLAECAEQIVWLDVPWHVAVFRIVRRHMTLSRAGTNRHPGLVKLARFAWGTRRYYRTDRHTRPTPVNENDDGAITRMATQTWLERFSPKVTRCQSKLDVDGVVAMLTVMRRDM